MLDSAGRGCKSRPVQCSQNLHDLASGCVDWITAPIGIISTTKPTGLTPVDCWHVCLLQPVSGDLGIDPQTTSRIAEAFGIDSAPLKLMDLLDELGVDLGNLFDLPEKRAMDGVEGYEKQGSSEEPSAAPHGSGTAAANQAFQHAASEDPPAVTELETNGGCAVEQGLGRRAGPASRDDALQAGFYEAADGGSSDLQSDLGAKECASETPVPGRPSSAVGVSAAAATASAFLGLLAQKVAASMSISVKGSNGVKSSNNVKGSSSSTKVSSDDRSREEVPEHIVEEAAEGIVSDVLDWWQIAGDTATAEVTCFPSQPTSPLRAQTSLLVHMGT